jgi:hypothetical protein
MSQDITKIGRAPALRFTEEDADRAFGAWGCNCGPGAIAAIAGLTLDELRPSLGDFERKRYTNPRLMWEILDRLGLKWRLRKPAQGWPLFGLARVQWCGPWTRPGVSPRAAYRYTHWVAARWSDSKQGFGIFDINAMNSGGWIALSDWERVIVPHLLAHCVPRNNGQWFLTHVVEIAHG